MSTAGPLQFPAFPEPGRSAVKADMIPTYAYNWCVSPLTPMAVAGVIWVPSTHNIGYAPADYAAELEIYAELVQRSAKRRGAGIVLPHVRDSRFV